MANIARSLIAVSVLAAMLIAVPGLGAATTIVPPVLPTARFAISRAPQPVIPELERRDRTALTARRALPDTYSGIIRHDRDAYHAYREAEHAVTAARDAAWQSMSFTYALPVQISEPLTLAMLDLHIEVRRASGPSLHTHVPALQADPGCDGDLIEDRLIYQFGKVAAGTLDGPPGDVEPFVPVLDRIARQTACLSALQLAYLERAIYEGFASVKERMQANGLSSVVPAFVRALAPVQLLVLDARKHRGERSLAVEWFRDQTKTLKSEVARAGWGSSDTVYLWDRGSGRLVGFPSCVSVSSANCIDLVIFISSLRDARALAFGDCALAAMVARGPLPIGTATRYVCPALACGSAADAKGAAASLNSRWPSTPFTETSLKIAAEQGICRDPANVRWQSGSASAGPASGGPNGSVLDQCMSSLVGEQPKSPWDTYAECTATAIGAGDPPQTFASFPGVPMGQRCGLMDEEADETIVITGTRQSTTSPEGGASEPDPELKLPGVLPADDIARLRIDTSTSARHVVHLSSRVMQSKQTVLLVEEILTDLYVNGSPNITLDDEQYFRALEELHNLRKTLNSCEGESCPDSCTGLGAQLAQANVCTQQLFDAFRTALGMPSKKMVDPQAGRAIRANYHPDFAPFTADDAAACVSGGDTGPASPAANQMACGLYHCPQAAAAATSVGGGYCACGGTDPQSLTTTFNATLSMCVRQQCAPGTIEDADCQCQPIVGEESGGPLIPTPPLDP